MASLQEQSNRGLVLIDGNVGQFTVAMTNNNNELTVKEVSLTESLLTPGLQTSLKCQAKIFNQPFNIYDSIKNETLNLILYSATLQGTQMNIVQPIYRMDNRNYMPINVGQTEEFILHACDRTLLKDAGTLVSRSWKCTSPTTVVNEVLYGCAGAAEVFADQSDYPRDYIAERIHPFQVVAQQANMAMYNENPDFVHYMTYGNGIGIHHFRSLNELCSQPEAKQYLYNTVGALAGVDYNDAIGRSPGYPISYSFPCDFDILSDILNGIDETGKNINTVAFWNPLKSSAEYLNGSSLACSTGANFKQSMTSTGTESGQRSCPTNQIEARLLKRQARMSLLERDKVALRMVVPWEPSIHAGDVISLTIMNADNQMAYGSGLYLVSSMTHKILLGGFSTTTFDCVYTSVGQGLT
jgi:hypothetical protein